MICFDETFRANDLFPVCAPWGGSLSVRQLQGFALARASGDCCRCCVATVPSAALGDPQRSMEQQPGGSCLGDDTGAIDDEAVASVMDPRLR